MGLLDGMFEDPLAQIGMGLLGGQSPNFGANVASSLMFANQLQKSQREARASDLQQIVGTYKILKDQDEQAKREALFTGQPPPPPNPLLAQHEKKLAELLGTPSLSQAPPSSLVQPPQSPQSQSVPPAIASQYSSAVRPELQAQGPMPQPTPQPQQPAQSSSSFPQLLQAAGIDPRMAAQWASTPAGQNELFKKLSDVYAPRVVNNMLMQLKPDGSTQVLGGAAGNDVNLVGRNASGGLQVLPVAGINEAIAARKGAETQATEQAKAPFTFHSFPIGPGGAPQVMSISDLMRQSQPQAPGGLPQSVIDQLTKGGPTSGTYNPGTGAVNYSQGGGLTGPNPIGVAADKAQAEDLSKFHAMTFIETQKAGKSAASGLQQLDRIDQLMKGVDTGKLTPAGMEIAGYAQALGLPVDKKLGNKQAAEALTGQIALELRNPSGGAGMPGALSDNDMKFLKGMTPGMSQTTEGRALIIETKRKLLERDQEVAQLARDYRQQNGGKVDDGFLAKLQNYSNSHQLFPQAQQQASGKGGWSVTEIK